MATAKKKVDSAGASVTLARFRADPKRVRVAVQHCPCGWLATVSGYPPAVVGRPSARRDTRMHHVVIQRAASVARTAVMMALRAAEGMIEGVDLSMGWAYEHPFKTDA
jgi:hypothetical protein